MSSMVFSHILFTMVLRLKPEQRFLVFLNMKPKLLMFNIYLKRIMIFTCAFVVCSYSAIAQGNFNLKLKNPEVYAGIEVGSKGVKMSVLEIGSNAKKSGSFYLLKDTSINTDFISFSPATFEATLNGLHKLYLTAVKDYKISADHIFSVVSSGVKIQAEKEHKTNWVMNLSDSFIARINEPARTVKVIDVLEEARLSHLGIVPDSRRYTTFLIDIGSGNTKGGYFPNGNTKELKLFQLSWGTKSTANATELRCEDDKSVKNFSKQLGRVLAGAVNTEVIYAVNESGAYNMSDYIAFSGGIAWSVATLLYPELMENPVVPVSYSELVKFDELLQNNYAMLSDAAITKSITDKTVDKPAVAKEIKRVHQVFDQKSLLAGTGLLLKVMRQFEGLYEKKQFYLVKNGQVGWISAYVNQQVAR